MHDRNHDDARRNLTAEEEAGCYTNGHPIGCFCPDCRPDYHAELARYSHGIAPVAASTKEAA